VAPQPWRGCELSGEGRPNSTTLRMQTTLTSKLLRYYSSAMRRSMPGMTMDSPHFSEHRRVETLMFCGYCLTTTLMSMSATTMEIPHCICAARDGHLEVARILLGRGAEVDARNHLEFTIPCASTNGQRHVFVVTYWMSTSATKGMTRYITQR
jgi:hypothetical protein